MIFFITVLRALAACLITNAHYTGVYPTDLIANGGLIGDVIFFAVSGYCLYNIKGTFLQWYSKRLIRCYLPVWLITAAFMLLGFYSLAEHSALWWYGYPTYYHFVASIVVLYIPYFIIMKWETLRKHIPAVMVGIALVYLVVYLVAYDKSYYHIDTVREPMIRFLFMESMLLGAWFRQSDSKFRNRFSWWQVAAVVAVFVTYFAGKLVFSKLSSLSALQIVNQVLIFVLLYLIFRLFAGLDGKLEKMPAPVRGCISFIARITLEIYVVQYVLIDLIRPLFGFPLNWFALTGGILLAATGLHYAVEGLMKLWSMTVKKTKGSKV